MSRKLIDLTGRRFGSLVVIGRAEPGRKGHTRWLCRCDCGAAKLAYGASLRRRETKTCGNREAHGLVTVVIAGHSDQPSHAIKKVENISVMRGHRDQP